MILVALVSAEGLTFGQKNGYKGSFHLGGKTGSRSSLHRCKVPGWMCVGQQKCEEQCLKVCVWFVGCPLCSVGLESQVISKEMPSDIFSLMLSCKQTSLCASRQTLLGLISQQKPQDPLSH